MKIAIAQINTTIGDFEHNRDRMKYFASKAAAQSCDLIVFPELAIPGYPPRDLLEKKSFVKANLASLEELIKSIHGIGVICGFIDQNFKEGLPLLNSAVLFEDGKILHKTNKCLLPTYDVFDERRYFEPGTECKSFSYKGNKIGLTICEDSWNDKDLLSKKIYRKDPVSEIINDGADLIINIAASPFHTGKNEFRLNMLKTISKKHSVPSIYANQVGGNDSLVFDGISTVIDKNGEVVARAADFKEDYIIFDTASPIKDIHPISTSETELILKALVLGTRDYVRKCGFSKVVIGLSGGIDSALTAAIAVKALGKENVLTIFMPSQYTSQDNFEDTNQLVKNLEIKHHQVPIDGLFKEFLNLLSPIFQNKEPGVTEQNIQARIRGSILMAFSNKHGSLVLTTGNKSELAVGYCTLYGDMNGGLAVISDVPKTIAWEISRYINREKIIIPVRIIEKAPSAELKPDQTDQDDLPPYDILDQILKGYIEEDMSPEQLTETGIEKQTVKDIIKRVDFNEYKRHQAAPGIKITPKAFGYGRRYPIAQRYSQYQKI